MDKLVRDNLESSIKQNYPSAHFTYLESEKLKKALKEKLKEEVDEFIKSDSIDNMTEEAGDVLEVLECLLKLYSIPMGDVQNQKSKKAISKGSFNNGVYWNGS